LAKKKPVDYFNPQVYIFLPVKRMLKLFVQGLVMMQTK